MICRSSWIAYLHNCTYVRCCPAKAAIPSRDTLWLIMNLPRPSPPSAVRVPTCPVSAPPRRRLRDGPRVVLSEPAEDSFSRSVCAADHVCRLAKSDGGATQHPRAGPHRVSRCVTACGVVCCRNGAPETRPHGWALGPGGGIGKEASEGTWASWGGSGVAEEGLVAFESLFGGHTRETHDISHLPRDTTSLAENTRVSPMCRPRRASWDTVLFPPSTRSMEYRALWLVVSVFAIPAATTGQQQDKNGRSVHRIRATQRRHPHSPRSG